MKEIKVISESIYHTAVDVGSLDQLMQHSIIHPKSKMEVEGKVFLKEATNATGTEISFQMLPPHTDLPYFHIHNKNEETYIILKGSGDFQVDDQCFPITEGSVIRVSPQGKRGMRNSSAQPMIYMVIQSKQGSLEEYSSDDGARVSQEPLWE